MVRPQLCMRYRRDRLCHVVPSHWRTLLLAMCCGGTIGWSEETPSTKPAAHPIFSDHALPAPAPPTSRPSRVSPLMSDAIKAKLPAYTPTASEKVDETPTDAIKLPPILVNAPKLRVPINDQVLSPAEFATQLRKLYPGASMPGQDPYHIANGMPNYARLRYENDRRNEEVASVENIADLADRAGDRGLAQKLKKQIQGTFGSTYKDSLIEAMDKSANGGRR
jgi:hypothetical protein